MKAGGSSPLIRATLKFERNTMSCYNINEFAHVSFGEMGICIGLPEDAIENEIAFNKISLIATEAGAHRVVRNAEHLTVTEKFDKDDNPYFNKNTREVRIYGEVAYNHNLRNVLLELQNQYGFPDTNWTAFVQKYSR